MKEYDEDIQGMAINIIKMQKYIQKYLICQTHNEPLNLACLDENCDKKGIICCYCQYKEHKHVVRSLGILFNEVDKDLQTYHQCLGLFSQLDHIFVQIGQQIAKIHNKPDQELVREMANSYFQFHVNNIEKRVHDAEQLKNRKIKTIESINEFILNYNFVDKTNIPNNYTNTEYELHCKVQEFQNLLKQLKENIKSGDKIQKIMKIFELDENRRIKYYFNSEKSHRDIIVVDKTKAELKEGYSYRIGLLDPPIRKEGGKLKRKTCTFKISKVTAMVGIGVVYKKKAETANYLFSAYSQHGCYLITNSGYTYNESNSSFNSQIKNWSYAANDIIKVTVEPKEKKILFEKQGKDIFQLPFEDKPELQLNFGILLCQLHESVEIV